MPSHRQLLPPISKEIIEGYFIYRMTGDNQAAHDIKAIEKGSLMFEGDRVLACSVHIRASTDVYLSGIVSASMKNKESPWRFVAPSEVSQLFVDSLGVTPWVATILATTANKSDGRVIFYLVLFNPPHKHNLSAS
ncbi:uncharacterized protein LOC124151372 [Haliotis rufescens]|uniref:uncharacterized protein LOC124151372 n=1 Tax=Haliotis rufescens TaxID=6454 RepID=UPI00201F66A3|nr:uncharacterized protein LOC124151372 [Haliotis rufescens]